MWKNIVINMVKGFCKKRKEKNTYNKHHTKWGNTENWDLESTKMLLISPVLARLLPVSPGSAYNHLLPKPSRTLQDQAPMCFPPMCFPSSLLTLISLCSLSYSAIRPVKAEYLPAYLISITWHVPGIQN